MMAMSVLSSACLRMALLSTAHSTNVVAALPASAILRVRYHYDRTPGRPAMKIERKPSTALLPTPVVLLTVAGHGKEKANIITLAWVGTVCSTPPMLSVAIRPSRHSHRLVDAAREFVVNMPRAEQVEQVDLAGVWSGAEHDKFEELGFTPRRPAASRRRSSPSAPSTSSAWCATSWRSARTTSSSPRSSPCTTTRTSSTRAGAEDRQARRPRLRRGRVLVAGRAARQLRRRPRRPPGRS